VKRQIDTGDKQGRKDPLSAPADRSRLVRLWPLWVVIAILLGSAAWRAYG